MEILKVLLSQSKQVIFILLRGRTIEQGSVWFCWRGSFFKTDLVTHEHQWLTPTVGATSCAYEGCTLCSGPPSSVHSAYQMGQWLPRSSYESFRVMMVFMQRRHWPWTHSWVPRHEILDGGKPTQSCILQIFFLGRLKDSSLSPPSGQKFLGEASLKQSPWESAFPSN